MVLADGPETGVIAGTVTDASGSPLHDVEVRAYFTDPRITLEFPSPSATLIGTQTVTVPPGGRTVRFSWTVPEGTNSWGERHWCVGAGLLHEDDMPLTTEARRTSNIAIRNCNTTAVGEAGTLMFAATNYLDVAAELLVHVDRASLPDGWNVVVPEGRPHVAGEMGGAAGTVDLLAAAAGITVPVLVVAGGHDRVLPVHLSRRLAETVADAELVELADVGHVAMMERPDEVTALLDRFASRVLAATKGYGLPRRSAQS